MDHRCLVLSGRLLDGQDPAAVQARMAAAFGMDPAGFRERVFERAPLVIRRGLDAATADTQAAQLRAMGADASVWPDDGHLAWLRRNGHVHGPLPEPALERYAEPGDQWCHDGGQAWFDWMPPAGASEPPPLPHAGAMPPPLPPPAASAPPAMPPAAPAPAPLSAFAVAAALFGLLALLLRPLAPVAVLLALVALAYLWRRPLLRGRAYAVAALLLAGTALCLWLARPAPTSAAAIYVPRPLQPLSASATASVADPAVQCAARSPEPKSDEDRFLLTGQRLPTGRAQRKGDTYVAEAAVTVDAQCQPNDLQLYVFHHGVLIGTVLDKAAGLANTRLADFSLVDDQHLRITLAQCTDQPADCAATTVREFAVMPGGGGWTLGEMK
ncbi:hypothetical protein [Dyella sedimenti]|uniref:hypothetical protein n=1 Tax=Dyella sedimenti TaxID=2919947 RepID=UPI001FA990EE|nr:hypothetical protein [Dyella sedimenti]